MDLRWGVGLGCVYRAIANKDVTSTAIVQSKSLPESPLKKLISDNQGETETYQCRFEVSKSGKDKQGSAYGYEMASGKITIKDNLINFGPAVWSSGKGDPDLFSKQSSLSVKNGSQLDGLRFMSPKKLPTCGSYLHRMATNQELRKTKNLVSKVCTFLM